MSMQPEEEHTTGVGSSEPTSAMITTQEPAAGRQQYYCLMYRMVIWGVAMSSICIMGAVGNFLAAYTSWPKRHKQATSLLLISLAVFDTLFLIAIFLNLCLPNALRLTNPDGWWLRWGYPSSSAYFHPIGRMGHYASTWTIIVITFHRYVAVCHPMKTKSWCNVRVARVQLLVITGVHLLIQIPKYMSEYVAPLPDGGGTRKVSTDYGRSDAFLLGYETVLYFIINHVLPFPSLLWMTYRLMSSLRVITQRREQMTRRDANNADLTRTLVAVVLVYIASQTPNPIRRLLRGLLPGDQLGCGHFYYYYHPMSTLILVSNSAVNFVLYYAFGRRFRVNFRARMRALLGREALIAPEDMSESTVATVQTANTEQKRSEPAPE